MGHEDHGPGTIVQGFKLVGTIDPFDRKAGFRQQPFHLKSVNVARDLTCDCSAQLTSREEAVVEEGRLNSLFGNVDSP